MKSKPKHATKLVLALLSFTFLLSVETYASRSCSVTCQAQTTDVVDSISSDNSLKIEDFNVNCRQFWQGTPSCSSGTIRHCTCSVRTIQNSTGKGYGTDIAEARAAAREECSRWFRASASVTYGNYICESP